MDVFIQRLPWKGFARRRLTLGQDKLAMHYNGFDQTLEDEYLYTDLNPAVKSVRRGEAEWTNVIFGLIIGVVVVAFCAHMNPSLKFKIIMLIIQIALLISAGVLFLQRFIKREYAYLFDASGDCILMLRVTPKSRPFIAKLREKLLAAGKT